jgi:signal transduction histidine kinase
MSKLKSLLLSFNLLIALGLSGQNNRVQNLDSISEWLSSYSDEEYSALVATIDSLRLDQKALSNRYYQHQLGNFYYLTAQYDSAYSTYSRAAKLASAEGDQRSLNALKNNLSVSLIELGRIPEAAELMTELLSIRKAEKDTARFLSTMGNLIEAYQILDNGDKVNQLLAESATIPVDSQRFAEALKRLHNLAYFQYYKEEKYDDALLQLRGLQRCNSISYTQRTEGELRLGLGRVYNRKKDFKRAHSELQKAAELFIKTNYDGGLHATYFELAELAMEENRQNDALEFYQRAYRLAIAPDIKMTALKGLLNVYRSQGKFEKALKTAGEIENIKDSLQSTTVQRAVLEIESKYQLRDKENTIKQLINEAKIADLEAEQLELKAKRLNLYIWSGGAFAVLIIAALIFFYQNLKLKREQEALKQELKNRALANEKQELKIQLFRSQINPHFFFNTLYSIQSYVLNNEPMQSSRYLGKFARLMRAVLELNENASISLEKELALLRDYLELEKLRFEDKFNYRLDYPEEIADFDIPTMILQPFVENAVVHGFTEISTGGQICLSVKEEEAYLLVEIEDNGKGYRKNNSTNKPGKRSMALELIGQRLKLLSQADGKNYRFEMHNLNDQAGKQGTRVRLYLPLNEN